MVQFQIKTDISRPVIDKRGIDEKIIEDYEENTIFEGKKVLDMMFNNYNLVSETNKIQRGNDNWYQLCGVVIRKMVKENDIIPADTEDTRIKILENFVIEHIVDSLMMNEKIDLLNYIYANKDLENTLANEKLKNFYGKMKKYLSSKLIVSKGITAIVIFDGPSSIENLNIFVLDNNKWIPASPEDKLDLDKAISKKYELKSNLNNYVGFIGFETNKKYMVYQIKDTENKRSTGFRCDQSGKENIINLLNAIENNNRFAPKVTKDGAKELCVRQELTLRSFEKFKDKIGVDQKTWFLDTETAIINEFQKKEKVKK
jgi:hypothetical protein